MKLTPKNSKISAAAIVAFLLFSFSPVSAANDQASINGATDTWTFNCQLATYYYSYYSFYGQYNWASSQYFYYNGVGNSEYYNALGDPFRADYELNNGLSLYYYYMFLESGDFRSANAYYYFYQAYALYALHSGLGDQATADSLLGLYLGYAAAA